MPDSGQNRLKRFLIAMVIGGLAGIVGGLLIKAVLRDESVSEALNNDEVDEATVMEEIRNGVAWQYADALQNGNWTHVIALTFWMEERLEFVARMGTLEDIGTEKERLIIEISTRSLADNQLLDTGVEDQYIFTPGARFLYLRGDDGRDDLATAVARRIWFKVIYPTREKALLDKEGIPIHSVDAGINVSLDGRVLKAGVVGNLDIDWESIQYDWPSR